MANTSSKVSIYPPFRGLLVKLRPLLILCPNDIAKGGGANSELVAVRLPTGSGPDDRADDRGVSEPMPRPVTRLVAVLWGLPFEHPRDIARLVPEWHEPTKMSVFGRLFDVVQWCAPLLSSIATCVRHYRMSPLGDSKCCLRSGTIGPSKLT